MPPNEIPIKYAISENDEKVIRRKFIELFVRSEDEGCPPQIRTYLPWETNAYFYWDNLRFRIQLFRKRWRESISKIQVGYLFWEIQRGFPNIILKVGGKQVFSWMRSIPRDFYFVPENLAFVFAHTHENYFKTNELIWLAFPDYSEEPIKRLEEILRNVQ